MIDLWEGTLRTYLSISSPASVREFKKQLKADWFNQHAEALDILVYTRPDKLPDVFSSHPTYAQVWDLWCKMADPELKLCRLWRSGWLFEYKEDMKQYVQQFTNAKDSSSSPQTNHPTDSEVPCKRRGRPSKNKDASQVSSGNGDVSSK